MKRYPEIIKYIAIVNLLDYFFSSFAMNLVGFASWPLYYLINLYFRWTINFFVVVALLVIPLTFVLSNWIVNKYFIPLSSDSVRAGMYGAWGVKVVIVLLGGIINYFMGMEFDHVSLGVDIIQFIISLACLFAYISYLEKHRQGENVANKVALE